MLVCLFCLSSKGQTVTNYNFTTGFPAAIQSVPDVGVLKLTGPVGQPVIDAGGFYINGVNIFDIANYYSLVIASNLVGATATAAANAAVSNAFLANAVGGVGMTNQNASAQSLSVADSFLAVQTTNVVVVTNAGTDIAKGTYLISGTFAGFANYTNQGGIKITNSGSLWIIYQTGVGSLYSSATLINQAWTQVSGNTPVPVSRYGMDIYMNGDLWGAILSTNLSDRLARSSNDATSFSFSQMTNVVSITSNCILVAVTNVFNSSTNATFKNSFTTNNEANSRAVVTNIYYSQTTNTFTSSLTTTNTASGITNFGGYYGNGSGLSNVTAPFSGVASNTTSAWQDPKIGTKNFRLNVHQAVERDFIIGDSYAGSCLDFFSTPYAQLTNLWATFGCAGSMGQSWNFSAGIIATALTRPESKSNWFAFAASAPTIYASDGSNDVIEANSFQGCVPVRFAATHGGLCWKVFPQGGNTHVAIVFDNGYTTNFTISSQSAGATTNTAFTNWNLAGINSVSTTTNVTFQIGQMDGTNTFLGAGFHSTNGPGIIACWASAGGTTLNTMISCDTNALNVYGQWALGSPTPTNAIGQYDALDGSEVTDENDLTNKLQLVLQNLMHGAPVFIDGPPPANQQLAFPADYELLANRGYQRYCAAFPNSYYVDLYDALPNFTNNLQRGMMNGVHPSIEGALERAQIKNALMGLPQLPTRTYGTVNLASNIVATGVQAPLIQGTFAGILSLSNLTGGSTYETNLPVGSDTNFIDGVLTHELTIGKDPSTSGNLSNLEFTAERTLIAGGIGADVGLGGGAGKAGGRPGVAFIATSIPTTVGKNQVKTRRFEIGRTNIYGTVADFTNLAEVRFNTYFTACTNNSAGFLPCPSCIAGSGDTKLWISNDLSWWKVTEFTTNRIAP